jgi:hypothetical protein
MRDPGGGETVLEFLRMLSPHEHEMPAQDEPATDGSRRYHQLVTGTQWIEDSFVSLAMIATFSLIAIAVVLLMHMPHT